MPYTKQTWTDETPASTPILYKISQDSDGDIATDAEIEIVTSVTAGSPVNATRLNYIEDGIETAQETAEAAASNSIPKSIVTAVGQLIYSTASGVLAALTKPSVDSALQMTSAGTPSWKALSEFVTSVIYRRQGGSSTIWKTTGTTNYSPSTPKIQVGSISFTHVNSTATQAITFPVAFSYAPLVFLQIEENGIYYMVVTRAESITNSGFTIRTGTADSSNTASHTVKVHWMAIGE